MYLDWLDLFALLLAVLVYVSHVLYHLKVYFVLPRKLYGMGSGSEQSLPGSSFASPAPWAGAGVKVFVIIDRYK